MVLEFIARLHTFKHRFIFVGYFRIKFNIQPLFHWADDEECGAAVKYSTVWGGADQHLVSVIGMTDGYLIKPSMI